MIYRQFGNTGIRVSALGVGCAKYGSILDNASAGEVLRTLAEALDEGINFFDTADIYGQGRSERLLGRALVRKRDRVVIATKAGYNLGRAGRLGAVLRPLLRPIFRLIPRTGHALQRQQTAQRPQDFSSHYLAAAVDASLRRLQTDYVDIFQLHSPPADAIRAGEFVEVLDKARSQGKIRGYGISCRSAEDVPACLSLPGLVSIQVALNLIECDGVAPMLERARRKGVAVIAREPLASGLLARGTSETRKDGSVSIESPFRQQLIEELHELDFLRADGRPMTQAALRFAAHHPNVSVTIAGMRSRTHLRENLAAFAAGPLGESELTTIRIHARHQRAAVEHT